MNIRFLEKNTRKYNLNQISKFALELSQKTETYIIYFKSWGSDNRRKCATLSYSNCFRNCVVIQSNTSSLIKTNKKVNFTSSKSEERGRIKNFHSLFIYFFSKNLIFNHSRNFALRKKSRHQIFIFVAVCFRSQVLVYLILDILKIRMNYKLEE